MTFPERQLAIFGVLWVIVVALLLYFVVKETDNSNETP
jgi:hypothetical protein